MKKDIDPKLHDAFLHDDQQKVLEIIGKDASCISQENELGQTVFWCAASRGMTDVVEKLLQPEFREQANPARCDVSGRTPVDMANFFGFVDIAKLILESHNSDEPNKDSDNLDLS